MKILHVIDQLNPGGAENVLITLANIQSRNGNNVSICILLNTAKLLSKIDNKIELFFLNRENKFNLISMYKFSKYAKVFDIIHVHSSHNLRYVFLSFNLFFVNKRIYFHEHFGSLDLDCSIAWHQKFIYPKVIFIGVSQKLCNWAICNARVPIDNVHLLNNIVSHHQLYPSNQTSNNYLSIIITSNIRREKNLEFSLRLLAELKKSYKLRLTIVGQIVDIAYREELEKIIIDNHLTGIVKFNHDIIELQPELKHYDLAFHSAKSESGPLVLIEYLAQNIPFLTYRTGEVVESISSEYPEFILNDFNVDNWISSFKMLMLNYSNNRYSNLRFFYLNNYSENEYYKKCLKIYQS